MSYFTSSFFGTRYFLLDLVEDQEASATAVAGKILVTTDNKLITASQTLAATSELKNALDSNIGEITKETTSVKPLDGDGWSIYAALGQDMPEATINFARTGTGNAYKGTTDSSNEAYNQLLKWVDDSCKAGSTVAKALVEIIRRGVVNGSEVYEGTVYRVIPAGFNKGQRDTSSAQVFSVNIQPFGGPIPAAVTIATNTVSIANPS